jgi:hypothetical protein
MSSTFFHTPTVRRVKEKPPETFIAGGSVLKFATLTLPQHCLSQLNGTLVLCLTIRSHNCDRFVGGGTRIEFAFYFLSFDILYSHLVEQKLTFSSFFKLFFLREDC